jgi:dipeptidyl aminopeptidase/acylaminoacyl peptidase
LQHGARVNSAQFSPDGQRIVTASSDNTARVWDAQTGQPLTNPLQHQSLVRSAQFTPDGKRIVTVVGDYFSRASARVWDAQTGQSLTDPLQNQTSVRSVQFSPDGKRIVTVSEENAARVWDAESGQPLTGPLRHGKRVNSAQFSPDGKRIVTASHDGTARVWDAQTGQPLFEPLKHSSNLVWSAQFSPDGKRIVTASGRLIHDGFARVWDAQSGQPLTEPMRYTRAMTSARFNPAGTRIVTSSQDGTARVWDAQTGQPLTESLKHEGSMFSAQFSQDGKRIVTASEGGVALVWDISPSPTNYPAWLSQLAEVISGHVLNRQGLLEPTRQDRAAIINQIRQRLNQEQEPDDDDWVRWGRWLLADPATRTISPFSKMTLPEYIENRIRDNTTESLEEAERLAGGNAELFERIAQAHSSLDQTTHATKLTEEADALVNQGKLAEAESKYREAVKLHLAAINPGDVQALNYLAWKLATSDAAEIRNGTNAVRLAEKAVAATQRKNGACLDTLAAAYAETQQFGKAAATQQEAIGLLQNELEKKDYASRLKLYQENTPYREPGKP